MHVFERQENPLEIGNQFHMCPPMATAHDLEMIDQAVSGFVDCLTGGKGVHVWTGVGSSGQIKPNLDFKKNLFFSFCHHGCYTVHLAQFTILGFENV